MRPPCIIVVEELLPEVRKRCARSLYDSGMAQDRIAEALGVSQAMVSRYVKEGPREMGDLERPVSSIARSIEPLLILSKGNADVTETFCELCTRSIACGMMDEAYARRFQGHTMPPANRCEGTVRDSLVRELTAAARVLSSRRIPRLVPAVKINIAQCLVGARGIQDVASFPGRLHEIDGIVMQTVPPSFGASKHLARILLEAHGADPEVVAVTNARYDDPIRAAVEKAGIPIGTLDGSDGSLADLIVKGKRAVADRGGFGIEPCLYIFGQSSIEVASSLIALQDMLNEEEL